MTRWFRYSDSSAKHSDQMHVIHVADSYSARNREKMIIEHGMLTYPMTCLNKVADARGQVKAQNVLYVVVKF